MFELLIIFSIGFISTFLAILTSDRYHEKLQKSPLAMVTTAFLTAGVWFIVIPTAIIRDKLDS